MNTYFMKALIYTSCFVFSAFINAYGTDANTSASVPADIHNAIRYALKFQDDTGLWPENVMPVSQMLADRSEDVRREVRFAIYEHLRQSKGEDSIREALVECLAKSLENNSPDIRNTAAEWLCTLKTDDFGPSAKRIIESELMKEPTKQLIVLGGVADVPLMEQLLQKFSFTPSVEPPVGRFYGTIEWGAELVRARNGNRKSIENVLNAVEGEKVLVTRVAVLFRELEYVIQPEIVLYLKKYVDSNERLEAVKPTVLGPKCAQYAAVVLAEMLEDFPVKKRDLNYTDDELDICRKWLSSQKEWTFK